MAYLRPFPVGALRIDGALVAGIDRSPIDAAIAGSIISLGHELGLTVIAQGVEPGAQKDTLRQLGCSVGQGLLFGRPTPSAAVPLDRAGRRHGA